MLIGEIGRILAENGKEDETERCEAAERSRKTSSKAPDGAHIAVCSILNVVLLVVWNSAVNHGGKPVRTEFFSFSGGCKIGEGRGE